MIRELILKNRSYRRFYQEVAIELETLRELIDLARLSASAANRQPLKYIICCEPQKNALIFPHLGWAGYLKDWPGPAEGERPSAYIIVLGDTEISQSFLCDHGCIIATIHKDSLRKALEIPPRYEILLVLALGKPRETAVIEAINPGGDIKYWRDSDGVHHVPKRSLDDIIIG